MGAYEKIFLFCFVLRICTKAAPWSNKSRHQLAGKPEFQNQSGTRLIVGI